MKSANLIISLIFLIAMNIGAQINYYNAFPNLSFDNPVDIQHPGDGTNRLFVVEQAGRIKVFDNYETVSASKVFLDISNDILYGGEQGLLGVAFHPEYETNGYFYIDYTKSNPRRSVISRFEVDPDNPDQADPSSELVLLEENQPYSNHNGGQISFGSDGYLYVSFGDGGSGGDPEGNGQNLSTLLGSIIRIDIDNPENGLNYGIPANNPFADNSEGWREEIYAYGLRNVWRFSFDSETGNLWAADVGQNEYEEINIIESGNNYGWNIMEGFHCYEPSTNCDQTGLTLPVWEYDHNEGQSITGGFVYRGSNTTEINGKYIYADYVNGKIWGLAFLGNPTNELLFDTDFLISTFGVDQNNELYFAALLDGGIYKLEGTATGISEESTNMDFRLHQNYPNPFNPSTTISFQLPDFSYVDLKIYDISGREVKTLINKQMQPGSYKVGFDASDLASGVYYYKLTSDNFSSTKKMIMIK